MSITIGDTLMTSDVTWHSAGWWKDAAADGRGAWVVSWLPTRLLDRNQAISAMTIAETVAQGEHLTPKGAALVKGLAAELHLDGQEASERISQAVEPRTGQE